MRDASAGGREDLKPLTSLRFMAARFRLPRLWMGKSRPEVCSALVALILSLLCCMLIVKGGLIKGTDDPNAASGTVVTIRR